MTKRVVSEKELTACYGLMFSEYPDIVNIRQLQTMLGISRHAAYDLLGEGEIGCIKLGNGLRQVLFAKRVPVKQEVKPPVAVWLEQTVR